MKIRNRLRLSYILMLLIPMVLIMLTGMMFRDQYENSSDWIKFPEGYLSELYETIGEAPESLLEAGTLEELANLSGYNGVSISIYRGGQEAAGFSSGSGHSRSKHFASSWNFYFSDGTSGRLSVFVHDKSMMKGSFPQGGLSVFFVIIVLILTNGVLSYLVAGSIIRPLNILKDAAVRIKNEDLESSLVYDGADEFRDVCTAFEEMRGRLKESLSEQMRSDENRKELLSSISHDLKTPITTIKGYIEGIKDGIADSPEKVEKYIDTVYKKSILMNDLIDRLFLFSKLDLNRVQFNFRTIDLVVFLNDICEELGYDYPELDILLAGDYSSEKVMADSIHLHRVVANLVDNAVKYRGDIKPSVCISLSPGQLFTKVKIKDNGRGIAAEDLSKVFENFYRSDPARGSDIEGSGLGLAIAKQIITSHGGSINVDSTVGKGSTISFTLRNAE